MWVLCLVFVGFYVGLLWATFGLVLGFSFGFYVGFMFGFVSVSSWFLVVFGSGRIWVLFGFYYVFSVSSWVLFELHVGFIWFLCAF